MNRVLGDYLETLLYKIFVSIDEHTPVSEVKFFFCPELCLIMLNYGQRSQPSITLRSRKKKIV